MAEASAHITLLRVMEHQAVALVGITTERLELELLGRGMLEEQTRLGLMLQLAAVVVLVPQVEPEQVLLLVMVV